MRPRLIPVLLIDADRRLVKTVKFAERTYVGDPFNVVRLFREKEVDEICVLDIDATRQGRVPDFGFLAELSSECFMPLAYGGGISKLEHCERLNRAGIEKIVLGNGARQPELVRALSRNLGAQATVACVDVRGGLGGKCVVCSGQNEIGLTPLEYCRRLEELGIGEIILQSVDRDGCRTGYDLDLISSVASLTGVPLIALGGAGDSNHLAAALGAGASAAASGSAFTFIGRLRAVLVNYPEHADIENIKRGAM